MSPIEPAIAGESVTGIDRGEFSGRSPGHGSGTVRRPIERLIMVNDDDAVTGQVNVEFEPVRTGRHSEIERRDGVLGPQRAATAMREHLRALRAEKRFRDIHRALRIVH